MSKLKRPKSSSSQPTDVWGPVRAWVGGLNQSQNGKQSPPELRFNRLMDYREQSYKSETDLDRAFSNLSKNAINEDALISIFISLPDAPDAQPFTGLSHGRRVLDPSSEHEKYLEMADHVDALLNFLKPTESRDPLRQLLSDLDPNGPHGPCAVAANRLWQLGAGAHLKLGLSWLSNALKGANPHKWYLTGQPRAIDAAKQTYLKLIADLNRHLHKPLHAALATMANANFPDGKVTRDQIRKAWNRNRVPE